MPTDKNNFARTSELEELIKQAGRDHYVLRLYVTGSSRKSAAAVANIRSVCEEHLAGRYELQVIDLYQQPQEARNAQIIAAPTLIKTLPEPQKRIIGDLGDKDRVVIGLNLQPASGADDTSPQPNGRTRWIEL